MESCNNYTMPFPIINQKEADDLDRLTQRYEELTKPGLIGKAASQVHKVVPEKVKQIGANAGIKISEMEIYQKALELAGDGFQTVEKYLANFTISEDRILKAINKGLKDSSVTDIDALCLCRSYDIARIVNKSKKINCSAALAEGGVTGFAGFAGIPFNLVLSTLMCFRAVQLVAMYYGYNVKEDDAEMVIASTVLSNALSPTKDSVNNEMSGIVSKVMIMTQASVIKQTSARTWTDMATHGGIPLILTQLRALANKAAAKALQNAGEKGIENCIFKDLFQQIGRKLTLDNIERFVPVVSALIGGCIDTSQMSKIFKYADIFYQKRFILEKGERVHSLLDSNQTARGQVIIDTELSDDDQIPDIA